MGKKEKKTKLRRRCLKYKEITESRVFVCIVYLILSFTTIVFVYNMIVEYQTKATFVNSSKDDITKDDVPVATICFISETKMKYGRDFTIQARQAKTFSNRTFFTLSKGKNEYEFGDNRTIFLKELTLQDEVSFLVNRSCVSIQIRLNEDNWKYLGTFIVNLDNDLVRKQLINNKPRLYLTTVQNSYGAVKYRWWDGEARPFKLSPGGSQLIQIQRIRKFIYLEQTCQHGSYYQCISSNVTTEEMCQENGEPCAPISLPSPQNPMTEYPICKTSKVRLECGKHIKSKEKSCQELKPCFVQEYRMGDHPLYSGNSKAFMKRAMKFLDLDFTEDEQKNKYIFVLDLATPTATRGKYTGKFQKDVDTEKLAWSGISVIGNIGGYMGLCVGFSFTGFIAWTLAILPKFWTFLHT